MDNKIIPYDENYIEIMFAFWYEQGRPSGAKLIEFEKCPVDKFGRKPVRRIVEAWINERGWRERADVLDAQAETKINDGLVAVKVSTLRRQLAQASRVRQLAFDYIEEHGFDSAASAISAFIKASELERLTIGLSKTVERLSQMDDDEVLQTVKELAERAGATTIIDAAEASEGDAEPLD